MDNIGAAKAAAVRNSDKLAVFFGEISDQTHNKDSQKALGATADDTCSKKDIVLLRKQLHAMLCSEEEQTAHAVVNEDGTKDTTNSSLVSEGQSALSRFLPAAARAMRATNIQKRLVFEAEAALRSALTAVAQEEEDCFELFEADAVQSLKSACEALQKVADDVSVLASFVLLHSRRHYLDQAYSSKLMFCKCMHIYTYAKRGLKRTGHSTRNRRVSSAKR